MRTRMLRKTMHYTAIVSGLLLVILLIYGIPLPEKKSILPEILNNEPLQEMIPREAAFNKSYGDITYTFTPEATYQIYGLVVSLHHSDSWIDISHENDPAQTVDVCVVWGEMITTNAYKKVDYSHGDWTCYMELKEKNDRATYDFINSEGLLFKISNNHLIPHNNKEARIIKSIRVGDQIMLSGVLSGYRLTDVDGKSLGSRGTSLTRTDVGNHACETIYLSEVSILKRNMPWRTPLLYILSIILILWLPLEIYLGIPRYAKRGETLTGKPHVSDPLDVKNYLRKPTPSINKEIPLPPYSPLHESSSMESHEEENITNDQSG